MRRGLARSREHASELIAAGRVSVNKAVATKPATGVTTDADLVVREDPDTPDYASRGAHKLLGALDRVRAPGAQPSRGVAAWTPARRPAGSPTCCCAPGLREVVAVDVGYGQLVWALRNDPRVSVHDRTNVRDLDVEQVGGPVDLVVGDLSFISLELVLDALIGVTATRR